VNAPLLAGALALLAVLSAGAAVSSETRGRVFRRIGWERRSGRDRRMPPIPPWIVVVAGALGAAIAGRLVAGPPGAVAGAAIVGAWPFVVRRRRKARRDEAVQEQIAEAVATIASCLRSGRSVLQAIEIAAEELDPPLGPSLRRLADRVELGEALPQALESWAADLRSQDARLTAGVLQLHRRTGGALASTLEELAATLRKRRSAARELRSLTAQARLSATILGLLPVGFFLFLSAVARQDLQEAYRSGLGASAIAIGLSLQAIAYLWIRHLLRIES
jgi:tight adherence protein B